MGNRARPLFHAYVDESGDRGWQYRPLDTPPGERVGSSRHFSMTAVVMPDGYQTRALEAWHAIKVALNRQPTEGLQWKNVKHHGQRRYIAETVAGLESLTVFTVVICKWHLRPGHGLTDSNRLYNWMLRLLVERLSWFGEHRDALIAMNFDQVKGLDVEKLKGYLRLLRERNTSIQWSHLKWPPKINTPKNQRALQVADSMSGVCFAAFERDDYGYTEQAYLKAIRPRLWRRPHRPLFQDGLKVGPWPHNGVAEEHPWLEAFLA